MFAVVCTQHETKEYNMWSILCKSSGSYFTTKALLPLFRSVHLVPCWIFTVSGLNEPLSLNPYTFTLNSETDYLIQFSKSVSQKEKSSLQSFTLCVFCLKINYSSTTHILTLSQETHFCKPFKNNTVAQWKIGHSTSGNLFPQRNIRKKPNSNICYF